MFALAYEAEPSEHIFAFGLALAAVGFCGVYLSRYGLDIASPIVGLGAIYWLYSISAPYYFKRYGTTYHGATLDTSILAEYYMSVYLGLVGLCLGILAASARERILGFAHSARWPDFIYENGELQRVLLYLTAVISIACAPFYLSSFDPLSVSSYTERALRMRVERSESPYSGVREVFLMHTPIMLILVSALALIVRSKSTVVRGVSAAVLLDYLFVNTLAGWRSVVMSTVIISAVYINYSMRPWKLREAVVGALLIFFMTNAISIARQAASPWDMPSHFVQTIDEEGLDLLGVARSGELATSSNLLRLILGLRDRETQFNHGSGWWDEIQVLVPRAILPERPLPLSEQYVETFYPEVHAAGGGHGLFIVQEGYWAFGLLGVFASMFFFGFLVERIYVNFLLRRSSDFALLCYCFIYVSFVLASTRSGISSSVKASLINLVPMAILLAAWVTYRIARQCHKGNPR